MRLPPYIKNVLIAFDRLGNTIIAGDPDETISARAGRLRNRNSVAKTLADVLDWIQPNHVQRAIEHDRKRAEHTEDVEAAAEGKKPD